MNIVTNHDANPLIKSLMQPDVRQVMDTMHKAMANAYAKSGHFGVQVLIHSMTRPGFCGGLDIASIYSTCFALSLEVLKTADVGIEMLAKEQADGTNPA
jgi:hypothetical protein